jgi:hypothetical protein
MQAVKFLLFGPLVALVLLAQGANAQGKSPDIAGTAQHPEALTRALYAAVSFDPGTEPDWSYVRSMFHRDASIVLRVSRDSMAVMTVDGFVEDFVTFIRRFRADTSGFHEKVVRVKPLILGNIAHMLVLYEASIPTLNRPPQQGIDSFHLVRLGGRWWITSIVNEVLNKERPLPDLLKE